MKKSIKWIIILSLITITCFALSACNKTTKEPAYYGNYNSGTDSIIINDDGFKWGDNTYQYSVSGNIITLQGSFAGGRTSLDFQSFENYHVLSLGIVMSFDRGTISSRNETLSADLYNFSNNLSLEDSFRFSSDGTFRYTNVSNYSLNNSGKYTLKDGVLILTGTYQLGKSLKQYYYITEDYELHSLVYIKDIEQFIPQSTSGGNESGGNNNDNNESGENSQTETKYAVTYAIGDGGTLSGTAVQSVISGNNGTPVTAVPNDGYRFIRWSDGVTTATRQENNVTANVSVTATFAKLHSVIYSAESGGSITGAANQSVANGEDATSVTALANDRYVFVSWSDGVKNATRKDNNITENKSVSAIFAKLHTVSYIAGSGGSITGTANQSVVNGGDGTTVTAVPNNGYVFVGWSDGVTTAARQETNVTENISSTASFEQNLPENTTDFAGGNGRIYNPYKISTLAQFRNVEKYPTANYVLLNDITLTAVAEGQSNFAPLFDDETMFGGNLDGNGKTIFNLQIYNDSTFYTGLFSCIGADGSVKNLKLANVNLRGTNYIGGIAAYSLGAITDCDVEGEIRHINANSYKVFIGGIVGRSENSINNNSAQIIISVTSATGIASIGGIVGELDYNGDIIDISKVTISAIGNKQIYIGGIIGNHISGSLNVQTTSSEGTIVCEAESASVGGIIGQGSNTVFSGCNSSVSITNVANESTTNTIASGGIIGYSDNQLSINDCFTTGNISASLGVSNSYAAAGGIVGYNYHNQLQINNCYSMGNVSSTGNAGGLAGFLESVLVTNSFSSGVISGGSVSGGIVGYVGSIIRCRNSFSSGLVTSNQTAGGIVGSCKNADVSKSFSLGNISATDTSVYGATSAGGIIGDIVSYPSSSSSIENCYALGDIVSSSRRSYAGGILSEATSSNDMELTIKNCYTTGHITATTYWGALIGYADNVTLTNVHWLYYADNGVDYAVGYSDSLGIPTNIGSTKHTVISDFYTLASTLNAGQETAVWENKNVTALPSLITEGENN